MTTPLTILVRVKAEPSRSLRIRMASGRSFEGRHSELSRVPKGYLLNLEAPLEHRELVEYLDTASLMLAESISHLEATVR